MASKEAKSALKAAREAIRNKDFKEALKQCKAVLAEDKNNYNALVFVGVAAEGMDQYDQALKAYRRAAEISPEQLLAWQGLSTMHTKKPGEIPKEEMVGVYEKLMELQASDKEKQQDAISKLISLVGDADTEKTLGLYEKLLQDETTNRKEVLLQLTSFLSKQPQLKPNEETMLLSSLKELFSADLPVTGASGEENIENYVQKYLKLLRKREPEVLFDECSKLVAKFPSLACPIETQLGLLLDRQMTDTKADKVEKIRLLVTSLRQLSDGSSVLLLAHGFLDFLDGKFLTARDFLQKGTEKLSSWFCGYFYLARVLFRIHASVPCTQTCQDALTLLSSKSRVVSVNTSSAADQLHLLAARCCLEIGNKGSLEQALDQLDKLSQSCEEADIVRTWIYLELSDKTQLEAILEKLKTTFTAEMDALRAWIDFQKQNYAAAMEKLQLCIQKDSSNADFHLKLGRVLWAQRQSSTAIQDQCFNTLLKAAKLDPYLSGAFLYLGHFYAELKKDEQRAKKCYQKAYDLDSNNQEAGAALCDMMAALGEEEAVQSLLQTVTETASAGSAKWAWLRLGLAQVRLGDQSTAVFSFQSALRADPSDRHVWECLAEAYLHRGSYTAALKAFAKVVEMYPDSTYCHYQMANIKQKLGALTEAADEYKVILDKSADYVPALKGLGETYLLLTKRYLYRYMVGMATDTCQQAIACLTRAATQRPDLSCLWKLMGDCCVTLHSLHASLRICVPRRLQQASAKDDTDVVEINKTELLELGTKCYGKALNIFPESAPLWHDLGLSFFYLCQEKSCSEPLAQKSQQALKKALSLDASNHMHWTALGVVAASKDVKNYSLAQHCFIKSVQCEANNAVAWTNLGALYIQHENIKLAHEAFKVAQNQDPEYVGCWIGQALVAETVGHEEAMDLFRHTTELAIHPESCLGYGHWVISTLLDVQRQDTELFQYAIKQMAAVPAAADALTRYTELKKDDPCAFNMLGLLLEHQGLNVSALKAFRRAVELADKSGKMGDNLNKIRLNLARLLSKNEKYQEASDLYQACAGSCAFTDICQWGLVLYKAGQHDKAYTVYSQAAELAETAHDRSDVYAALGMLAFKAGNLEGAKAALFQGFQSESSSLHGLFALCALGLLQGDATLTQASLQELSGRAGSQDVLTDVATLMATSKVLQGEGSEAMTEVEQLIEGHSQVVGLYLLMSRLGIQYYNGYTAHTNAKQALDIGGSNRQDALLGLGVSQLLVGKHSRRLSMDSAIRTAQKAFHNRPDDVATLCCLISAVHGEAVIQYITGGDSSLLSRELGLLDLAITSAKVTRAQKCWCMKQRVFAHMFMDNMPGASEALQQLLSEFPEEKDIVSVLECVVSGNQASLEPLVIRDGSELFFWQVLLSGLLREKKLSEAGLLMREALQKARAHSSHVVRVVCLVTIAWIAAQRLLRDGDETGAPELEEVTQTLEQLSKQPYTMLQVLQALVCLDDNPRKAKHHFANAMEKGHAVSNLGVELSLARRGIIFLLHSSDKDQDRELVESLLSDAKADGDRETVSFYDRFSNK